MENFSTEGIDNAPAAVRGGVPLAGGAANSGEPPRVVTTGENLTGTVPSAESERYERVTDGRGHARTLIHPVPLDSASPTVAHIDWLSFTIRPPEGCELGWLLRELRAWLGDFDLEERGRGAFGYERSHDIGAFGILASGGKSQKGTVYVSINAQGCARVADWQRVKEWGDQYSAKITRVDLAHDDFEGGAVNIKTALKWYEIGGFAANGRPPAAQFIDDLSSGKGKTLYIGSRKNGKLLRVYEKGRQLGDVESPWTRVELELHGGDRVIPWDILTRPGQYLAGSYPCLNFLSTLQEKIRTITKSTTVSLQTAVRNGRQAVGKLVNVMMQVGLGDAFAVVNQLVREGVPKRLENYSDFLSEIFDGMAHGSNHAALVT